MSDAFIWTLHFADNKRNYNLKHYLSAYLFALSLYGSASARDRPIIVPLGLPELPAQYRVASSSMVAIGGKLFFDTRLSAGGSISCATCHVPERLFTDGRIRAIGNAGQSGTRNTPSLLNVVYSTAQFWDGRVATLESQARLPLVNPREHGLSSEMSVVAIVNKDPEYRRAFWKSVGRKDITMNDVVTAIASYERTLLSGHSVFDQYMYGVDRNALSDAAVRGLAIFRGRGRCAICHTIGENSALFTDQSFHASPIGLPPTTNAALVELTQQVNALQLKNDLSALNFRVVGETDIAALGRFVVTLKPMDIGRFRTPSLRNVALTAPYFHDGSVATLNEAVDIELYNRGDAIRFPIVVTAEEKKDLVEFLIALNSN